MDLSWLGAVQWGTVPDWFSAAGTVGAVIFAVVVSRRDGQRLRVERAEAQEDRMRFRQQQAAQAEALKRQQAAKVSVIAEGVQLNYDQRAIQWKVHNAADEPISMVTILQRRLPPAPEAETGGETGSAPEPSAERPLGRPEVVKTWPLIEAGGHREFTFPAYGEPTDFDQEREVQFTDGAGLRWRRTTWGKLQLVDPDGPESVGMLLIPVA